jgi:hypothetical protein
LLDICSNFSSTFCLLAYMCLATLLTHPELMCPPRSGMNRISLSSTFQLVTRGSSRKSARLSLNLF